MACLYGSECSNAIKTRGLCATHYVVAARLVRKGWTTWVVLESRGLAMPLTSAWNSKGTCNSKVASRFLHRCEITPGCVMNPGHGGACSR